MKDLYLQDIEPTIFIVDGQNEVQLHPDTVRALTYIALKNNIGYGTAIIQSIVNENFLDSHLAKGSKLIVEYPDGSMRELVRRPAA